jgi:ribA/ribD-fused uncharacterized protein
MKSQEIIEKVIYDPSEGRIDKFDKDYSFLSNFYIHSQIHDGKEYLSNEHWYQSNKSTIEKSQEIIRIAPTPGIAKRMGGKKGFKGFKITLREDWENIKIDIMMEGLRNKFSNLYLKKLLLQTKNAYLCEGNVWHDNFWGHCICDNCKDKPHNNILGQLLMIVRKELLNE